MKLSTARRDEHKIEVKSKTLTSYFMLLSPHVQDDGLVVLVGRDGDHAGLAVVPVHGHRGVSPVLKPVITAVTLTS